ncbi:hypothetical protein PC128_g26132 [Phytophthora cactorum]|nr:hypothetical protein PC128_g26132 [Phytophthora cactorum]
MFLHLRSCRQNQLVYVGGHTLHFTSTSSPSQHFLLRSQPRKLVTFAFNWKLQHSPSQLANRTQRFHWYSYPDKKLRDQKGETQTLCLGCGDTNTSTGV